MTTTALKGHKCIDLQQQKTLDSVVQIKATVKFSDTDKQCIRDGALKFIVNDLRPFYSIEGSGLNSLIGSILAIGKRYPGASSDDVMNLLPCRTTLRKHVVDTAKIKINDIKAELQQSIT